MNDFILTLGVSTGEIYNLIGRTFMCDVRTHPARVGIQTPTKNNNRLYPRQNSIYLRRWWIIAMRYRTDSRRNCFHGPHTPTQKFRSEHSDEIHRFSWDCPGSSGTCRGRRHACTNLSDGSRNSGKRIVLAWMAHRCAKRACTYPTRVVTR